MRRFVFFICLYNETPSSFNNILSCFYLKELWVGLRNNKPALKVKILNYNMYCKNKKIYFCSLFLKACSKLSKDLQDCPIFIIASPFSFMRYFVWLPQYAIAFWIIFVYMFKILKYKGILQWAFFYLIEIHTYSSTIVLLLIHKLKISVLF